MYKKLQKELEIRENSYEMAAQALLENAKMGDFLKELRNSAQKERNQAHSNLHKYRRKQAKMELTTEEILGPWTFHAETDMHFATEPMAALVYMDTYYIEILKDEYYLMLENEDWVSQSLPELEARLAEFVLDCGDSPWVAEYRGWDYR